MTGSDAGIEPREKQAVGQHLREGVGEFLQRQFVKHLIAENLEQTVESALLVIAFLPDQFLAEIVAQQLAARRERQR